MCTCLFVVERETQKKSNLFSTYQNTKIIQNNVYKTTSLKLIIATHRLYICVCVLEYKKVFSVYEKQTIGHNNLNMVNMFQILISTIFYE